MQYVLIGCFIAGVLLQNIIAQKRIIDIPVFQEQNLLLITQSEVILEEFIWYVVRARAVLCVILFLPLFTKNKRRMVNLYLCIFAFLAGGLCVASVLEQGFYGIFILVASLMPQYFLYGLAWSILFLYCYHYPKVKMNITKMVVFLLFYLAGIVLEIYVNPMILKFVISVL